MVALPLLIVAATLGYSLVDPEGNMVVQSSWWPDFSTSRPSSSNGSASSRWIFGYGVVLGMGLSSALSYEIRRRRLWERVRVTLFAWLQDSSVLILGKYRKPTSSDNVEGTPMIAQEGSDPCGIRREIVSPDWCHTSTMNVTILTLYTGSELVAQASTGVEFYYVLKGEGIYKKGKGEDEETLRLSSGTCFVIDPFCFRGFQAKGRSDLVLLRAADTIFGDGQDVTRRETGPMISTTVAMLNAGLHKVEALVSNYTSSAHHVTTTQEDEKKDDMSYV